MLTPRQDFILSKVVEEYLTGGQPVSSKAIATSPEVDYGPSTIRNELAMLEEHGLLAHPHTSAGRVPTDAGQRYVVDRLLASGGASPARTRRLELSLISHELDEAMRVTTETLSQVTNLLAIVSAPPLDTATIRHVEVLTLQPQVLMVVIITSTGGVSKRIFTFPAPVDSGLVAWSAEYLNLQLTGLGLGARTLKHLADPSLGSTERDFLTHILPAFSDLAATAEDTLYFDGAARLFAEHRLPDLSAINELMEMLERRVSLLAVLRHSLVKRGVYVRIGEENEAPALRTMAMVASGYGLTTRTLGTVSVIGPVRMDYAEVIATVGEAAAHLSHFVEDLYGQG